MLSPESFYYDRETARIESFVRSGGTHVVAEDMGAAGNQLLAGIDVSARVYGVILKDQQSHYRSPALLVVTSVTEHDQTGEVKELTLNYGTAVVTGDRVDRVFRVRLLGSERKR